MVSLGLGQTGGIVVTDGYHGGYHGFAQPKLDQPVITEFLILFESNQLNVKVCTLLLYFLSLTKVFDILFESNQSF